METKPEKISESVLKKCVLENVSTAGWIAVDDLSFEHTTAVATKEYPTAVGLKTAIMYLYHRDNDSFKVITDYQSQGQNILETTWLEINKQLTFENIKRITEDYIYSVDKIISESYAARLLKA